MLSTLSEHAFARLMCIGRNQVQQCGRLYVLKKFLTVALLHKHALHQTVAHSLALPRIRELVKHHPKSTFKYLHGYLSRALDIRARSAILANHYHYLDGRVKADFIGRICRGKIPLWETEAAGHRYGIALTYPNNEEGELFLTFTEDDTTIFTLSFTIAPGNVLELADEQVAFIGRLQGVVNQRESIRRATKALQEVAPAALLLDAVRAISTAMDIPGIVGVSAENQICLREKRRSSAASVYDEFWISAGAYRASDLGYYLPTELQEKPLSSIQNKYRSRVKRKRQFRSEAVNQIRLAFESQCLGPHQHFAAPVTPEIGIGNYCGTLPAMNAFSFTTSASITSQRCGRFSIPSSAAGRSG